MKSIVQKTFVNIWQHGHSHLCAQPWSTATSSFHKNSYIQSPRHVPFSATKVCGKMVTGVHCSRLAQIREQSRQSCLPTSKQTAVSWWVMMFVHSYSGKKWFISEKRNLEEKKSCDIYNMPLLQSYERGGKCRVGEQSGVIVPADTHTQTYTPSRTCNLYFWCDSVFCILVTLLKELFCNFLLARSLANWHCFCPY